MFKKSLICFLTGLFIPVLLLARQQDHPRLFLRGGEEKALMANIARDEVWTRMHRAIIDECAVIDTLPLCERIIKGPRMHAISCEVLRRVLMLSYAYRTEGLASCAARAEKEMLHAAAFIDWNPSHFLDVAEMSTALAIGYDWLYDWLPAASRDSIRNALVHKGLEPALDPACLSRFSMVSNWGQVCNGGMAVASIALLTEEPEKAQAILDRSRQNILIPMQASYPPDGCFPEGFGYWAFGTQYNILFLDALWRYFGRDSIDTYLEVPGFIESGNYSQQLITPSLQTFGYSDNSTRIYLEPAVMWFNAVRPDPKMYYWQKALFERFDTDKSYVKTIKNRLIPFMVIWGAGTGDGTSVRLSTPELPQGNFYAGHGTNDICVMRTGWTPEDAYLGFKAGKVRHPHGHMDIGSFYYEYKGVRWSLDLGSDDYGSVQVHGIGLFDMWAGSDRWTKLTKYNNFAHSTTYPEGTYQETRALCTITENEAEMTASSDLTALYPKKMKSLRRTVRLVGACAEIEDFVECEDNAVTMVWNMTTEAISFKRKGSKIILTDKDGKQLELAVNAKLAFTARLVPAKPEHPYEGQNEGISFLRLSYTAPSWSEYRFTVKLTPLY